MIPRPGFRDHLPGPEAGMQDNDAATDLADPAAMSPADRTREVAALLARGYLRHRTAAALSLRSPQKSLEETGDHTPPCPAGARPKRGRARKEARK